MLSMLFIGHAKIRKYIIGKGFYQIQGDLGLSDTINMEYMVQRKLFTISEMKQREREKSGEKNQLHSLYCSLFPHQRIRIVLFELIAFHRNKYAYLLENIQIERIQMAIRFGKSTIFRLKKVLFSILQTISIQYVSFSILLMQSVFLHK